MTLARALYYESKGKTRPEWLQALHKGPTRIQVLVIFGTSRHARSSHGRKRGWEEKEDGGDQTPPPSPKKKMHGTVHVHGMLLLFMDMDGTVHARLLQAVNSNGRRGLTIEQLWYTGIKV